MLVRDWRKYLIGISIGQNGEENNSVQSDKENIDEVVEATSLTSEEVHGGVEATSDIPDSPSASEEGEQDKNNNKCKGDAEEKVDNDNGKEVEEPNKTHPGDINHISLRDDARNSTYTRRLQNAVATVIGKLAEDLVGYDTEGDDIWDTNELMLRRYTRRNIFSCRKSLEKSKIIIALDFSGSCYAYSNFFHKISLIAEKFGDVEIFDASNGFSEDCNLKLSDNVNYPIEYFYNRKIIFFGDFDGGESLVKLSRKATVYWFSCEERYQDMDEHGWCGGYTIRDFKNYRKRYFRCINEKDFIRLIKKIK